MIEQDTVKLLRECDAGVKSLNRYLNRYKAADERSKGNAKRLIHLEQTLAEQMRESL